MNTKEMRGKNAAELKQELESLLRAHFALRMQVATQQSSKTADLGKLRRDIARVKTIMREKAGYCPCQDHYAREGGSSMTEVKKMVRTLTGRVVSDKMNKTVTVLVERRVKHPVIGKVIRLSKKYHAHDENNEFHEGDMVQIEESRKLSRTKAWTVSKLIERARV